MRSIPS